MKAKIHRTTLKAITAAAAIAWILGASGLDGDRPGIAAAMLIISSIWLIAMGTANHWFDS